jgi:DNA-binding GntR family transcriptional regulator
MDEPTTSRRRAPELFDLPALVPLPTAAERVAEIIRDNIFEGRFPPGSALPEAALAQRLQVSRNTVREAFRTLMGEHLLEYEVHKGVAVRRLTPDDARDIYRVRLTLEMSAIDRVDTGAATVDAEKITASVTAGRQAADDNDWIGAGTANLRFHAEIVALHGSPRLDAFFQGLMTEMRLGFLALDDPRALHEPYLHQNELICEHLVAGRVADARLILEHYLKDAMEQVVAAVAASATSS